MSRDGTTAGMPDTRLPRLLRRDGWWLATENPATPEATMAAAFSGQRKTGSGDRQQRPDTPSHLPLLALAVVVPAGDLLLYRYNAGLALAVFAVIVFGVNLLTLPSHRVPRGPTLLLAGSLLPFLEFQQAISVAWLTGGLAASIVWTRCKGTASGAGLATAAARLFLTVPLQPFRAFLMLLPKPDDPAKKTGKRRRFDQSLLNWTFPLLGSAVIVLLLAQANPVLDHWLGRLVRLELPIEDVLWRLTFWALVASLVWPFLSWSGELAVRTACGPALPPGARFGLNARSAANALILFNLLLGLQLATDLRYLWAGEALPDGLSYSAYARRGAYALMATAILAGGFAVLARPFLGEARKLRGLMFLWIGQNLLLTVSAGYRLWLYVDAYGLTYLRIHAAIWMALVAIGLVLIAWQMWRARPVSWLAGRISVLALAILHGSSFINFEHVVASHNLRRASDRTEACAAGYPALEPYRQTAYCRRTPPRLDGWRDWDFRTWRAIGYLEADKIRRRMNEDPRR